MFILQNPDQGRFNFEGIKSQLLEISHPTSKFDLTLTGVEDAEGLSLQFEYATDLFEDQTIVRMAEHYEQLIKDALVNPHKKITELKLLTENELNKLLIEWNKTADISYLNKTISQLFENQVLKTPNNIALIDGDHKISFDALNRRANTFARYIRYKYGISQRDHVAISLSRSMDAIVAILALLKLGVPYVPIDQKFPQDRKLFIIRDTAVKLIITEHERKQDFIL